MNKKIITNIIPCLIILIVYGGYYFINLDDNKSLIQGGGDSTSKKSGYPKGTPLLYQFRYIVYLPELKLTSWINSNTEFDIYSSHKYKLYLFHDEINLKKKIRLQLI